MVGLVWWVCCGIGFGIDWRCYSRNGKGINITRKRCRFIRIFGEFFKLNYANPNNPLSLKKRINEIKTDFNNDAFKSVIEGFDSVGQRRTIRFVHNMLKRKKYFILLLYYMVSMRTRKIRLKLYEVSV